MDNSFLPPAEYTLPHFSTKLFRSQLNYLKANYSEKIFIESCSELNMPLAYLLADDNWVSASFNLKFANLLAKKTGDAELYRKIGKSFFTSNNINPLEYYLLKIVTPHLVLMNLQKYIVKINQVCFSSVVKTGVGIYKVKIWVNDGLFFDHFVLNFLGSFEGLGVFFELKNYSVKLVPYADGKSAEFIISFSAMGFQFKRILKWSFIIVGGFTVGYLLTLMLPEYSSLISGVLVALIFIGVYFLIRIKDLLVTIEEFNDSKYKSSMENNRRIHESLSLADRSRNEARQVAHDIRSPLSVLNMLIPNLDTVENEKIDLAKKAVDRASQIAENALNKGQVDLKKAENAIKEIISEKEEQYKVNIEFKNNIDVRNVQLPLSETNLKRIVSNLLNNSVEALGSLNGNISVLLGLADKNIEIKISDSGKGIPKEILHRIGEKGFSYGKSESTTSGSGLGLYHAKETIKAAGGSLEVQSGLGEGTAILIRLSAVRS